MAQQECNGDAPIQQEEQDQQQHPAASSSRSSNSMRKQGCLPCCRLQVSEGRPRSRRAIVSRSAEQEMAEIRSFEGQQAIDDRSEEAAPMDDHLVIFVNGIVGSANNWKFAAEMLKEKLPGRVQVHCSACNSAFLTFHGVDVMGRRLANEVLEVVSSSDGVKKISFVAHSLGGLVARYAISQLYIPPEDASQLAQSSTRGTIAGLHPVNFITLATPHLGSRGSKQLPLLCGVKFLEKIAVFIAHWFVGRTGRHLFLADGHRNQPPLLRRMVTDCDEGMFISALRAFKRHVAYANVDCDHMVGRKTASIRRDSELTKVVQQQNSKYPHIVSVEKVIMPVSREVALKSPVADVSISRASNVTEEEMIEALTEIPWERVDVSFRDCRPYERIFSHSTIQVKSFPTFKAGQDVIEHMIDHFIH